MQMDESLYRIFQEEIKALENFQMAYAALHPGVSLDREDPDVTRLIEAMALFSSRTRVAGVRNIKAVRLRIFQQFFPYFLSPLPSMAMIQATPSGRLAEYVELPKGSEIAITPDSGVVAFFRTTKELGILPISLDECNLLLMPDKGFRLTLHLKSTFPRREEIGELSFQINHLNSYESSLLVLYQLRHNLKKASVVFDEKATETSSGSPCAVSFGLTSEEDSDSLHPLQRERLFFHFPWQDLFVNIKLPSPPQNWTEFTICLDLDAGWPRNLYLNKDVFQLFAVPVINLRQGMAQPISCDGTKERYLIHNSDQDYGFELHSVKGVFETTPDGMAPVRPGILSGTMPSYETETTTDPTGKKRHYLNLHFPQAFDQPKTIATDALWFQPKFSEGIGQRISINLNDRNIIGLKWDFLVRAIPHTESFFQDNIDTFLNFLTLTNKGTLNRDDLLDIIQAVGVGNQPEFKKASDLLQGVRTEEAAHRTQSTGGILTQIYYLNFQEYAPNLEPIIDSFLTHVEKILDAWISGAAIEVRKEIAGSLTPSLQED